MPDKEFIKGMFFKPAPDNAPDWVKGKVSIKLSEFAQYIRENCQDEQYLNVELKVSKNGKGYAEKDNWKPKQQESPQNNQQDDSNGDLPF